MENLFSDDSDQEVTNLQGDTNATLFVQDDNLERNRYLEETNNTENLGNNQEQNANAISSTNNDRNLASVSPNDDEDILSLGTVNIKTRRKLVVLNDEQLLANSGLPYLRKNFKDRVRFKSSTRTLKTSSSKIKKQISFSTEYDNATKMLQFYQLWAHSVFPKANFEDFVTMCYYKQTLYKNDRLVAYRRKWINDDQTKEQMEHENELEKLRNELDNENESTSAENRESGLNNINNGKKSNDQLQPDLDEPEFSDTEMERITIPRKNAMFVGESEDEDVPSNAIINDNSRNEDSTNKNVAETTQEIKKGNEVSIASTFEHGNIIIDNNNNNSNNNNNNNENNENTRIDEINNENYSNVFDDSFDDFSDNELEGFLEQKSKLGKESNNESRDTINISKKVHEPPSNDFEESNLPSDITLLNQDEEYLQRHEAELEVLRDMGL